MQGQKSNLSIFNFSKGHLPLLKQITVFFIPVVLCYALLEISILNIPMSYEEINRQITTQQDKIKVMVLGSSQMQSAVNPEYIDKFTVNYGSTSQHHKEDNFIMQQSMNRFPNLETIVFELSYAHLEIPHNGKDYWKNTIYLKYYDVNAFERNTYFKDKLVFLSSPSVYSKILIDNYIRAAEPNEFNEFGYNKNYFNGSFNRLKYDEEQIEKQKFVIRDKENLDIFTINTPFFYKMIKYALDNNKSVIIAGLPTYKTYLNKRNSQILNRRDSILNDIRFKFPEVKFLNSEEDTTTFNVQDYRNENHLNPRGAKKFTKKLNEVLND